MNRRMVFYLIGQIIKTQAVLLTLPLITAIIYREQSGFAFLITIIFSLILGFTLTALFKPQNKVIYAKEGFVIVALAWITMSAVGALPFVLSGEIPNFFDAFFETVSGFTTTGASILNDVESLSHCTLFWRSFTHWVGGMGVLVFVMAILPTSDRSIHIMRAEVPGPVVGKLVPKIRDTAKILYLIYIILTGIEFILLLFGGMSVFDSLVHSFGTAGTGGFGIKADSIAGYNNYLQWVITIFMVIFGLNFNLYYLLLLRRFKAVLKSGELWCFLGVVGVAIAVIAVNIYPLYKNIADCIRLSGFQVASIISTTGYSTADFNQWPELSKSILFVLMFIGGCAGSTAGGLKLTRVIILFKSIKRELTVMLHPRSVGAVKLEDKRVGEHTLRGVHAYFAIYMVLIFVIFLILSFEPFDFETTLSAAVSCFNNIGPGLSSVGPASSYADFSAFSKVLLSFAMLLGRLEIYPIILAFSPSTWAKK